MRPMSLLELRIGTNSGVWYERTGNRGGSLRWELREQLLHDADFGGLYRDDVVREYVHVHFLTGERRGEEILHHLQRADVVLDHVVEIRTVEVDALGRLEVLHLCRRQHAGHHPVAPRRRIRRELLVAL